MPYIHSPQDEIGLKEWALSLRSAHKQSQELLGSMARKAGKIYGTAERDTPPASHKNAQHQHHQQQQQQQHTGTSAAAAAAGSGAAAAASNTSASGTNGSNN